MAKYRIISELDPGLEHREPRGTRRALDERPLITTCVAGSLAEAAADSRDTEPHRERRIISIEEIHPGFDPTDEEITRALTQPEGDWTDEPMLDPDDYVDADSIYMSFDFTETVTLVVTALRESDLVPGIELSLISNSDGSVDYSMVEIHDDVRGIYLSRGSEIKHLTENRNAAGWDGIIAIARALIYLTNDLH